MRVLFLGKENNRHCVNALDILHYHFADLHCFIGDPSAQQKSNALAWKWDIIISFMSKWIIPEELIKKARIGAINFHPGSPAWPGVGCINFALYENSKEYGATCHYMEPKVDTGTIISEKLFPILEEDTIESLLGRTYDANLALFNEVIGHLVKYKELPKPCGATWTRKPYKRTDLNELSILRPTMSPSEIARRTRATTYLHWKPTMVK